MTTPTPTKGHVIDGRTANIPPDADIVIVVGEAGPVYYFRPNADIGAELSSLRDENAALHAAMDRTQNKVDRKLQSALSASVERLTKERDEARRRASEAEHEAEKLADEWPEEYVTQLHRLLEIIRRPAKGAPTS